MQPLSSSSRNRATWLAISFVALAVMEACQRKMPPPDQVPQPAPDATESRNSVETSSSSIPSTATERLTVVQRSPGKPQIDIDVIASNNHISGHVMDLAQEKARTLRVLVYVHTDQWYIHPYAAQGEGSSWAAVDATFHWQIPSVKRAYAADQVAALLVSSDTVPPPTVGALGEIHALAWIIVKGNGDV